VAAGGPGGDAVVGETPGSGGGTDGGDATEAGGVEPADPSVGAAVAEAAGIGSGGAAMAPAPNKESPPAIATAIALVEKFIMPLWLRTMWLSRISLFLF
jgi:hypothetical protein